MAYTSQSPKNDSNTPIHESVLSKLRGIDKNILAGGTGYSAPSWLNDCNDGELGPYVLDRLRIMCAALANGAAHYTHVPFVNDQKSGHLGPDLLAKLNAISVQLASIRP